MYQGDEQALMELQDQLGAYRNHLDNLWVEDGVYFLIFGIGMGLFFLILSNVLIVYSMRYMGAREGYERRSAWLYRLEPAVYIFGFVAVFLIALKFAEGYRIACLEAQIDAISSSIEGILEQNGVTA